MRTASLLIFLALAGSATAAVIGTGAKSAAEPGVVAAAGSFSFANSSDGMPIFSADGIAPGDSVSGTVEIANDGDEPGELSVAARDVEDTPGLGGGELSGRLSLRIADVTVPTSPIAVYAGPLAPMPAQPAGVLGPGTSRTYEFVATLPETGPAGTQNEVQGASTSVAYSWTAGEVTESPGLPPPASGSQAPTPSPLPPAASPASAPLRLTIARVRHRIRHGRLIVWAHCNNACAIAAHGRLRATGPAGQRAARLRLNPRPQFATGRQRLAVRIHPQQQGWLQAGPKPARAKVQLALSAHNRAGERATAHRAVRLRMP